MRQRATSSKVNRVAIGLWKSCLLECRMVGKRISRESSRLRSVFANPQSKRFRPRAHLFRAGRQAGSGCPW